MAAILLAFAFFSAAPDEIFSGPQKGEKIPPFKVLDVSGPNAGKEVDYIAEWRGAPTLLCFIHELTRPGAQLIRRLDAYGLQNKDSLRTLFISLSSDPQESQRRLPVQIKAIDWKCPVAISVDGREGPGAYGLNKDVLLTVIAARDGLVVGNWAIVSPNETDFPRIQALLDKLLEPNLETPEAMKAEILRLRGQLSALRAEVDELKRGALGGATRGRMEGAPQKTEGPGRKAEEKNAEGKSEKTPLPGKAPTDPKLVELFRRMIRMDSEPQDVDQAIRDIEAHVKGSADLQKQVADGLILIDHLGYGSDYSKAARKKLAAQGEK